MDAEASEKIDEGEAGAHSLGPIASRSFRSPSPYGSVLIMSPWNYPVMLTLEPLDLTHWLPACGHRQAQRLRPAVSAVLKEILEECFPPEHVFVVTGGPGGKSGAAQSAL